MTSWLFPLVQHRNARTRLGRHTMNRISVDLKTKDRVCNSCCTGRTREIHKHEEWRILLLMEEILHQLISTISHSLNSFIHPRWCRISAINSTKHLFWGGGVLSHPIKVSDPRRTVPPKNPIDPSTKRSKGQGSVFSQPQLVKTHVFRPYWLFILVVQYINVKWRVFWYLSIYLPCWVLSHLKALCQNHPKSASTRDHSQLRFVRPCFDRGMSIVRMTLIYPHFKKCGLSSSSKKHQPFISFNYNWWFRNPAFTSWAW